MLNTRELEKRWLKYKIKSYLPYVVITTSVTIIFIISIIFVNTSDEKNATEKQTKKELKQTKVNATPQKTETQAPIEAKNELVKTTQQEVHVPKASPVTIKDESNNKLLLKPSMGFMQHIQNEEQQPYYKTVHKNSPTKTKKVKKKRTKVLETTQAVEEEYIDINQEAPKKKAVVKKIEQEEASQKQIITIKRRDSEKDIKEIIKRFKKNNNPALSLFVAKKYYELGNYEQAYNYALITNGINNDIEDSWLIFAKSLVKLHRKEMAIKTLTEYIKYSHSGNAKMLLNDIKSGKFQ